MKAFKLGEEVAFRCIALQCRRCDLRVTDGITKAMIDAHENHFEVVTIEIEIIDSGLVCKFQPISRHYC